MPYQGLVAILNDVWDAINHRIRVDSSGSTVTVNQPVTVTGTVNVGNLPATQPVSGTVTANQGTPNAGGAQAWHTITDDISTSGTLAVNGDTITLTGIDGRSVCSLDFSGGSGAWVVEGSVDGSTWRTRNCVLIAPAGSTYGSILSALTSGLITLQTDVGGLTAVRVRATGTISTPYTVMIRVGNANGPPIQAGPVAPFNAQASGTEGASIDFGFWDTNSSLNQLNHKAMAYLTDGVNGWFKRRTPVKFVTAQAAAAGNTALWTPAAGKKFRLMRYLVTVTDNATLAAAGVLTITLFDAAAGATGQAHDVFVPAIALNNSGVLYNSGWIDLGNGVLSAAANNVLNINLSAALATGNVRVIACGTEE